MLDSLFIQPDCEKTELRPEKMCEKKTCLEAFEELNASLLRCRHERRAAGLGAEIHLPLCVALAGGFPGLSREADQTPEPVGRSGVEGGLERRVGSPLPPCPCPPPSEGKDSGKTHAVILSPPGQCARGSSYPQITEPVQKRMLDGSRWGKAKQNPLSSSL